MRPAFRHLLLRKHDVQYFQCGTCGFLQTETPYWLDEAYSSAIVSADTGIMQRNVYLSRMAAAVFWRLFRGSGRYLDAAGGYGLFTRLMRDIGLDYYWSDPHAQIVADLDLLGRFRAASVHLDLPASDGCRGKGSRFVKSRRPQPAIETHSIGGHDQRYYQAP